MIPHELKMAPAQMASLLDSALRHPRPLDCLDAGMMALRTGGREQDGTTVAWVRCLPAEEEVEIVMELRAA